MVYKERCQRRDIGPTLPQGWHDDGEDVKPIIEVGAKTAFLHCPVQVAITRSYDAHIHFDSATASKRLKLVLLQDSQEFYLSFEWKLADFIEEQGPAICDFKSSRSSLQSAGKGAFHVAEELTLNQARRDGATVYFH